MANVIRKYAIMVLMVGETANEDARFTSGIHKTERIDRGTHF